LKLGNGINYDMHSVLKSVTVLRDVAELFDEVAGKYEGEEVGVLVCGPGSLQESVAIACRARNFESLMKTPFHYHSVSFDL